MSKNLQNLKKPLKHSFPVNFAKFVIAALLGGFLSLLCRIFIYQSMMVIY